MSISNAYQVSLKCIKNVLRYPEHYDTYTQQKHTQHTAIKYNKVYRDNNVNNVLLSTSSDDNSFSEESRINVCSIHNM